MDHFYNDFIGKPGLVSCPRPGFILYLFLKLGVH